MSMTDDVGAYLESNGLGTVATPLAAGTIFSGFTPTSPDNIIALFETPGFEPVRVMGGRAMSKLNLQVLVRNKRDEDAEAKAKAIFVLLDTFVGLMSGVKYFSIMGRTEPYPIGVDENKRRQWTCNYVVHRAPTT